MPDSARESGDRGQMGPTPLAVPAGMVGGAITALLVNELLPAWALTGTMDCGSPFGDMVGQCGVFPFGFVLIVVGAVISAAGMHKMQFGGAENA